MKRFLTIFLSLILSLSSLMLISCKDTSDDANTSSALLQLELIQYESVSGIRFTDNAPIYTDNNSWRGKNVFLGATNELFGMDIEKLDGKDDISVFERFVEIYDEQIKDKIDGKGFYFIDTGSSFTYYAPWARYNRVLMLCADAELNNQYLNPVISQKISFGDISYPQDAQWAYKVETYKNDNNKMLYLNLFFTPVDSIITSTKLRLEYCKTLESGVDMSVWRYYINIYVDNVCIGTCQFNDTTNSLPKEWYEWYFTTYLYRA